MTRDFQRVRDVSSTKQRNVGKASNIRRHDAAAASAAFVLCLLCVLLIMSFGSYYSYYREEMKLKHANMKNDNHFSYLT